MSSGKFGRFIVGAVVICQMMRADAAEPRVALEHPRLLGNRAELKEMARARPQEFERMMAVARSASGEESSRALSMALAAAITEDSEMAKKAQRIAMKYVNGPIRQGHVTFGYDLALTGLIYDLCYEAWPETDREKFHHYFNKTVDANVNSETHVFHNGWYAYKNWGIGIAAYATYHENPRSPEILRTLQDDYRTRAAPALELAGAGGGWAEGYYIHYWLYEWLFFCEVARRCGGVDHYQEAPSFYRHRALASAFETYPGLSEYGSRRPVPMGDGGGRLFGGDRDKQLAARRILVSRYRDDPVHQALHAFNELTPRVAAGSNAYKDFLWRDTTITKGELKSLPLSHHSPGPGYLYARSSWQDDATYFFFKAGDRFTAHQHLDNGHFLIFRAEELAGDGGHYDSFGSSHDVNYHCRTIAHSTITVRDPSEKWPSIRGGKVLANDGGQHHNWPHHNGAVGDPREWLSNRALYDIAEIKEFAEKEKYLLVAADLTRSYSSNKLSRCVRQIVYLRPGTFVIFDEVVTKNPEFETKWLLQAMKPPIARGDHLVITHGQGRLWLQTLLPRSPRIHVAQDEELYRIDGRSYPPTRTTGPAPEARIEVSPAQPALTNHFLHVLTVADAAIQSLPSAELREQENHFEVRLPLATLRFSSGKTGPEVQVHP